MNHVPTIEIAINSRGLQHGLHCALTVGAIDLPFSGTLGGLIEKLQWACQQAEMDGQREVYESLINKGYEIPCPVCGRMMSKSNPLSEDVVMCVECRYE